MLSNTIESVSADTIYRDFSAIRQQIPLIHNMTNMVVMNNTANALLAIGAAPIMAHAPEELDDLLAIANALLINIGTLDVALLDAMQQAMRIAAMKQIPIIIDPVGAGASPFRTAAVLSLLTINAPTVIRANASEILALANHEQTTKGVDAQHKSHEAIQVAQQLALRNQCVVVISGEVDICCDGSQIIRLRNGSVLMSQVTGMGCTATAVTAAFLAVNDNALMACTHAMAVMGIAGECAAEKSQGPGSFAMHFLDSLHHLTQQAIAQYLKVSHD